jgi:hypothetical protein
MHNRFNPFEIDLDDLISRLSGPLNPEDREAFRAAAEAAVMGIPCLGEGAIYRAVAALQRSFFHPPETKYDVKQRVPWRQQSKLISGPPLGADSRYRRRVRG